mmetsp:Transcript_8943/g.20556  ORF Transcript_8943/g.20556 Transcript_8943/m.20556 type:complete len:238 (+) Transcript_8943:1388-2101(+)
MMRFTHKSWIALSGESPSTQAPRKAITIATKLTVSWNCRNLQMLSYTQRPHLTAITIELKLSSIRMMSDASLATSVPAIPIEKPTSAFLSAGASLVPSPVTATTWALQVDSLRPVTRVCLSCGDERARTLRKGQILSISSWLMVPSSFITRRRKSGPSNTSSSPLPVRMPHFRAIDLAVITLSPVTIRTSTPALWHFSIAAGTSGRTGSSIPTMHKATRSRSTSSSFVWSTPSGRSR